MIAIYHIYHIVGNGAHLLRRCIACPTKSPSLKSLAIMMATISLMYLFSLHVRSKKCLVYCSKVLCVCTSALSWWQSGLWRWKREKLDDLVGKGSRIDRDDCVTAWQAQLRPLSYDGEFNELNESRVIFVSQDWTRESPTSWWIIGGTVILLVLLFVVSVVHVGFSFSYHSLSFFHRIEDLSSLVRSNFILQANS